MSRCWPSCRPWKQPLSRASLRGRLLALSLVWLVLELNQASWAADTQTPIILQPTTVLLYTEGALHGDRLALIRYFEHTMAANGWILRVVLEPQKLMELMAEPGSVIALTESAEATLLDTQRRRLTHFIQSGGGVLLLSLNQHSDHDTGRVPPQRLRVGQGRRVRMAFTEHQAAFRVASATFAAQVRRLAREIRWVRRGAPVRSRSPEY